MALALALAAFAGGGMAPRGVRLRGPVASLDDGNQTFGTVVQGTVVHRAVTLRNHGDASFNVLGVVPDCSCTVAMMSSSTIRPSGAAVLDVSVDTSTLKGRVRRDITLVTDDPVHKTVVFALAGVVSAELESSEAYVDFGTIADGGDVVRAIYLGTNVNRDIELLSIRSTDPKVGVTVDSTTIHPGTPAVMTLRCLPNTGGGRIFGNVIVATSSSVKPELRIPIRGTVAVLAAAPSRR